MSESSGAKAVFCWHYTVGMYLPKIIASGAINPATAGVPVGERPAVWFSTHPVWEETANKAIVTPLGAIRTRKATHKHAGGLVRIGVSRETAPHDWAAFKSMSGITRTMAGQLESAAIKMGGKPRNWFVSFDPVTYEQWLCVEAWNGKRWLPLNLHELLAAREMCAAG